MSNPERIWIIPSFHYDVAYLESCADYLPRCFRNITEALRILDQHREYRFLLEQVFLLEAYWEAHSEQRDRLRRFASEGRLAFGPGMYVMPDMNHPDGESLYRQAYYGRRWLKQHLAVEPRVCWIADCWGHHAQLPQILRQAGYEYYVFWRCMRRDVMRRTFRWAGLDGTEIRTCWLPRGYGNIQFPTTEEALHTLDLNLKGCGPDQVEALCRDQLQYAGDPVALLCNGGDFMYPQASAPDVVRRLNESGKLPPLAFATPDECLPALNWRHAPLITGEFNSALQGTFTSNIRLKQHCRQAAHRLTALETMAALLGHDLELTGTWKLLLKQQFHDIICGTICDAALEDALRELDEIHAQTDRAHHTLCRCVGMRQVFNPLSFPRSELVEIDDTLRRMTLPALGFADPDRTPALPEPVAGTLPLEFSTPFYRVRINEQGYLTELIPAGTTDNLVQPGRIPFGSLAMQMDYGDLWLNFQSPLSGGSPESALTQNHPDPYDHSLPGALVARNTTRPEIKMASICLRGPDELEIEQIGVLRFWRLAIPFCTRIRLSRATPRIDFMTTIQPRGRHYRLRVAFPTPLTGGRIRHEIPFGIQERGPEEHAVQNWFAADNGRVGLGVLNRGTPGTGVDANGVLLQTLFRSAAMEYKAESTKSYCEGVEHTFHYAALPFAGSGEVELIRQGLAFNRPHLLCAASVQDQGWHLEGDANLFLSVLRRQGRQVFVRLYEGVGKPGTGVLHVPAGMRLAKADGLEVAVEALQPCEGTVALQLRPFEVANYLFEGL